MHQNTTFSTDIISKNKLESTLNKTSSIAISKAVHAAGHDLRTPLFVLRGYSQLLQRTKNLGNSENKKLQLMVGATQKMENLINVLVELVDFQTLDFNESTNIQIKDLFEEVRLELINEIDETNSSIQFESKENLSIQLNHKYIFNLLKHLVQNALVHNMEQEKLNINISFEKINNSLEIIVEDNGKGMDLSGGDAKLYQPFYRHCILAKSSGVGLCIVKTIVDRLGGSISIESEKDKGTRCKVLLNV
ncbi:MAG: ATP-binding protein [Saprospiraceae bacterium]